MLASLPSKLARMEAEGVPAPPGGLFRAAADTYNQALQEIQKQPANWLRVYDLVADVSACLEQIENPVMRTRYRPVRYWYGDVDSPAADVLALMYAAQFAASSSQGASDEDIGSSAGDSGGGGDSGGFGGGDSGGGGASSDY